MFEKFHFNRHSILGAVIMLFFIPLALLSSYGMLRGSPSLGWDIFGFGLFLSTASATSLFLFMRAWELSAFRTTFQKSAGIGPKNHPEAENTPTIPLGEDLELGKNDKKNIQAWEELEMRANSAEQQIHEAADREEELQKQMASLQEEMARLAKEKEKQQRENEEIVKEFQSYRGSIEDKLEQNRIFLSEHQKTINEQRHMIEGKQQTICQLENKVRDLTYEIKTLLTLAETAQSNEQHALSLNAEPSYVARDTPAAYTAQEEPIEYEACTELRVCTADEAAAQLKRCIDIAQKMTGASHYSSRYSRLRDLSPDNFAIDLRCLFDSLRSETGSTILVYSPKEEKMLFVNPQVKTLLGWSSEKFLQSFSDIIAESEEVWKNLLGQLAYKSHTHAAVQLKSKDGQQVDIECHLGMVPTGIFRGNVIGVLYDRVNAQARYTETY